MSTIWQDVRQGLRMLGKSPGFTLSIALTLGLGIGANAAVFSIVNTLLLKPLPVREPNNLYLLTVSHPDNEQPHNVSWLDYVDYRDRSGVFSELAAYQINFAGLSANNTADRIAVCYVTGNYFPMLGIAPGAGRLIQPNEGKVAGADPVIVLGRTYWKKRFNGDPGVVGRSVLVNGRPFTVVGVVPEGFTGTYTLVEFEAYMPLAMTTPDSGWQDLQTKRDDHELKVLGRLNGGVTIRQAQAAVDVLASQLEHQYPDTNKAVHARVVPEHLARPEANSADTNPFVAGVFLFLVGLVLLVACVNVINLLMVRATIRQRELAVRAALGAGRSRLVRQLLTESMLLAILGAVVGALVGRGVSGLIAGIKLPADIPISFNLAFDWRVFGYISAIAAGAGLVVGLFPALRASRTDLNDVLREGGRSMAEGGRRQRVRSALVVAQVAVSLVLLVAAALFVRSVQRARSMDLGFDPAHVVTLSMDVSQQGWDEARGRTFYDEVQRRVARLPGVETASYAYTVPFSYYSTTENLEIEGQPTAGEHRKPSAGFNSVTPEYFDAMKIPVVRGRAFTSHDGQHSRKVAIVNELFARRFWPNADAIGKRFRISGQQDWLEIVGITRSGKYVYMFEDPQTYVFVPLDQQYRPLRVLVIRAAAAPLPLAKLAEREIRGLNPDLPVYDVRTMQEGMNGPNGFFLLQMGALFGGALGILGLVLALVGIYGVVSYAASQRTQEIGVRMALGAQRKDIMRLVLGHGLVLVGVGILLGLAASFGVSRLITSLLFGVSTTDAVTFVSVPLVLGLMALVASYVPAFRATKVDPVVALRAE